LVGYNSLSTDCDKLDRNKQGFIADYVTRKFDQFGSYCINSNWAMRNITARLSYALMFPAMVISRVADAALSPLLLLASLATFGNYEGLNNAAFGSLQLTGLLRDIFYCASQVINPREYEVTGTRKYLKVNETNVTL
jgi:hypothetical protein